MSFPETLQIRNLADDATKHFVRNSVPGAPSSYRNVDTLGSPTIQDDRLQFRVTTNNPPSSKPELRRRSHNTNREVVVRGSDGKDYTLSVNLTITCPVGNFFTADTISDVLHDVLSLASDFGSADGSTGAGQAVLVDPEYIQAVRIGRS